MLTAVKDNISRWCCESRSVAAFTLFYFSRAAVGGDRYREGFVPGTDWPWD
jgi:hypothetical protein